MSVVSFGEFWEFWEFGEFCEFCEFWGILGVWGILGDLGAENPLALPGKSKIQVSITKLQVNTAAPREEKGIPGRVLHLGRKFAAAGWSFLLSI